MEKIIILEQSKRKGKRYRVSMSGFPGMKDHFHDFASDIGKTFIDHKDDKKKKAWVARHSTNKNYNNIHSAIYMAKSLLWNTPDLKKNIELLSKKLKSRIIVKL